MKFLVLWYLSGVLTLGYLVAGTFFLKFWHRTRERIFAWFAASFGMLALQRLMLSIDDDWAERGTLPYILRAAAFVVLIIGIVEQNRATTEK
ncbi:MAG: DUF5985 family protein [Gemmatimonadaceae bacterium]